MTFRPHPKDGQGLLRVSRMLKHGCSCRLSDAWRCAVDRRLGTVACSCKCHRLPEGKEPVR